MFGVTSGALLGHIVSKDGIAVDPGKIKAIVKAWAPSNTNALSRFLGKFCWHSRMLCYLADFATLLHVVVHCMPFKWTTTEDKVYEALKVMLTQAPVVQPLVWLKPFHIFVDAFDIAIGSALMQLIKLSWYQPVYYSSRKLIDVEPNYSTTEREALGMLYNINKFQHYLLGRKFTFHVDHTALLYLVAKKSLTGKLAQWMLLLQEFEFKIQHRPRTQHGVTDYVVVGHDNFPDAEILCITIAEEKNGKHSPDKWLMEMISFLSMGLPPLKLRTDEKK